MKRHKPILFDQLRKERRPARRSFALAAYNVSMQFLFGVFRLLGVLLATAIASISLTVVITSFSQDCTLAEAAVFLWEEMHGFFQ